MAVHVTIHAAKTNLSKLIEAALAGEEVVISRGDTPVARLVPITPQRFRIGLLRDELGGKAPDFLEAMSEEDLKLWEGGA